MNSERDRYIDLRKEKAKKGEKHFYSDLLDINEVSKRSIRYVKSSFI